MQYGILRFFAGKTDDGERGQAMVEFTVVIPALIILLVAMQVVAEVYLVKQKTEIASRYAAWKKVKKPDLSMEAIGKMTEQYFFEKDRGLMKIEAYHAEGSDNTLRRINDKLWKTVGDKVVGEGNSPQKVSYKITYSARLRYGKKYEIKDQFGNVVDIQYGQPFLAENLPDSFSVSSFCEVDSNSWNGDETEVHELFKLVMPLTDGLNSLISTLDELLSD
ncbi:MAG: hypothetical protein CSA26_06530 [Desulfobacterales bacterium]|nr:MAG: hypothetical protein CSA26_06530 [Desulfobacterales bacterium]